MSSAGAAAEKKADAPSMIGRVLDGRFRVDALLGEGGLGQVFRGTHLRLHRPVAIKVMHAHHVAKDELRTRFEREARSLAALAHPNVVGVIDYGLDGDVPFLVMELLEGRTLETAIQQGLPSDRVVPIFRDVLRAVAYAHGIGLVHRDLKPANVFLQKVPEIGEVVRVLDFGLAKFIDGEGVHATVTRAGMVIGTPAYMSPEQATASVVDARADVYSLGVMLFEMITGQRPFSGDDGAEVLRKHLLQPLPKMGDLAVGSPLVPLLEPFVLRATEKSKADRFADASDMALALDGLVGRASTPLIAAPKAPAVADTIKAGDSIHVTISDVPVSSPSVAATVPPPRPKSASRPAQESAPAPAARSFPVVPILVGVAVIGVIAVAVSMGGGSEAPVPATEVAAPPPTTAVTAPPPTTEATAPPPTTVVEVAPPTTVVEVAPPTTVVEVAPPTTTVTPPGPLQAAPIPPQLVSVATRVDEGREISGDQRALLYRFARNHPHDARAYLILGHAEVIAHALTDACHRYQHAFDLDATSRYDARMRHDLVMLAAHAATNVEAGRMVRAIYGRDALDEITRVQGELGRDTDGIARLTRLAAAIDASE